MNPQDSVGQADDKFKEQVAHFEGELKKLRTGRASASMLDGVMVVAYGSPMPLIQVGNVSAPEAQLLQITPFDPSNISAISAAIRDNPSLGLNPSDDGRVVRISIPPLTTERRQQIVKQLSEKVEDCMIAMRQTRHDAIDKIDKSKKDKDIGEDEAKRLQKLLDDSMAKVKAQVDALAAAKEQEIMKV